MLPTCYQKEKSATKWERSTHNLNSLRNLSNCYQIAILCYQNFYTGPETAAAQRSPGPAFSGKGLDTDLKVEKFATFEPFSRLSSLKNSKEEIQP